MNSFYKRIATVYTLIYVILIVLLYLNYVSELFVLSAVYAGVLNLINSLIAVKLFNISYKKNSSSFMIYNLGGLGLRLMLLLIVFVIVIKFLNIDEYGFILIFFLFYFTSLVFEVILYINRTQNKRK